MPTQALLYADDPECRAWLDACLDAQVALLPADAGDGDALIEEVQTTPGVGLVFVQFDAGRAQTQAAVVEGLVQHYPGLPVVGVGDSDHSDTVLAAMRAGVRDYLVLNRDDDNLNALVARVLVHGSATPAGPAHAGERNGRLYAVTSGPQNAANAFIALHLALALQRDDEQKRVLLLDLTLPGGASLVFLDTEQEYSALDALRDVHRCDETLIETAFTRFRDGFYLLSLPEDTIGAAGIDVREVGLLASTCAAYFDAVVVAADGGLPIPALAALLSRTDATAVVTDQSVLKSRQNKQFLHALRVADCSLENAGLIIDHFQARLGMDPERIARLLDLDLLATFAGRSQARIEAMNTGVSMFEHAPRDSFVRELTSLLERMTGEQVSAPAAAAGGVLSRLFKS